MFNCQWIRAPRDVPPQPRLYQRTYGRTYGRRQCDTDQPVVMPEGLQLSETMKLVASDIAQPDIAHDMGRAA